MANRRKVLEWAGVCAIAALAGFGTPVRAAVDRARVTPPDKPMRLTRRLVRQLGPGADITLSRSWKVDFLPRAEGWLVEGDQIAVEVDAPAMFEELAKIERQRKVTEAFPIMLDTSGTIHHAQEPASKLDMQQVAAAAEQVVGRQSVGQGARDEMRLFMGELQRGAGTLISRMPDDLFFPDCKPQVEKRSLAVPGGGVGEIEMLYIAKASPDTGLLQASERRITTRFGGSELQSAEYWMLTAI